jgi:filamin
MSRVIEIDPKRVSASGSGVDHGVTGQMMRFQVQGMKGQLGALTLNIDGPSQPAIEREVDEDGNINCSYIPTLPGDYTMVVKANDKHIKSSPFQLQVIGTCVHLSPNCSNLLSHVCLRVCFVQVNRTPSLHGSSGSKWPAKVSRSEKRINKMSSGSTVDAPTSEEPT